MKNIKSFNPIVLARNAIAATGLLTTLNIIVVALHFTPIFPLSLVLPINSAYYLFNIPTLVVEIFGSLEQFYASRPFFALVTILMMGLVIYSYLRSAKKPSAIKIGFGVLIFDTLVLVLNFSVSFNFLIDFLYHAFLLFYIYKGIRALKEANRV